NVSSRLSMDFPLGINRLIKPFGRSLVPLPPRSVRMRILTINRYTVNGRRNFTKLVSIMASDGLISRRKDVPLSVFAFLTSLVYPVDRLGFNFFRCAPVWSSVRSMLRENCLWFGYLRRYLFPNDQILCAPRRETAVL